MKDLRPMERLFVRYGQREGAMGVAVQEVRRCGTGREGGQWGRGSGGVRGLWEWDCMVRVVLGHESGG